MAKGRAAGSKVESYTFRKDVVWKADKDALNALAVAGAKLLGEGTKITRKELVSICVQRTMDNLSPQKMVEHVRAHTAAQEAAAIKAKQDEEHEAARKALEAAQKAFELQESLRLARKG
tara:strand:+ start:333 stop:689 length:357 start_codon:yes stop_codon:yes gene_type:complete